MRRNSPVHVWAHKHALEPAGGPGGHTPELRPPQNLPCYHVLQGWAFQAHDIMRIQVSVCIHSQCRVACVSQGVACMVGNNTDQPICKATAGTHQGICLEISCVHGRPSGLRQIWSQAGLGYTRHTCAWQQASSCVTSRHTRTALAPRGHCLSSCSPASHRLNPLVDT